MNVKEKRVRRSAAQWRELIDAQRDSGMSQKAFCNEHGLALGTFVRWKSRLASPDEQFCGSSGHGELIELVAPRGGGGDRLAVELELGGGVVLRLRRG